MEKIRFPLCIQVLLVDCVLMASLAMSLNNITTDRSALLAFKSHLLSYNHNEVLDTNWSVLTDVCHWIGVTCSKRHRRVTGLNLANMSLVGSIPPHFGNLSFLVELNISYNNFHDPLPRELVFLPRLRILTIEFNNFGGEIPSWLGIAPRLESLLFSNNLFTGSVPSNIFNISSLYVLDFESNKLSGSLPVDMCDNLKPGPNYLYLSQNQLHGQVPSALFKCKKLQDLWLSENNFTGSVPREIGNLTMLETLHLDQNDFKGEIPYEIGYLHNLNEVTTEQNGFTGPIPTSIFNLSSLTLINFDHNSLSGHLPLDICHRLPELEVLSLEINNIAGSIPRGLKNCTSLVGLYLGDNNFAGIIPEEIGDLPNIEVIRLVTNSLTGDIPWNVFNISNLKILNLLQNRLTGQLPSSIGFNLPNLEQLYLGVNNLTGIIPNSICNASQLVELQLSSNSFTGFVPKYLGNLKLLRRLNLHQNLLTAESSSQGLEFFTSLTNCKDLASLAVSSNPLSGVFPNSIGNFSALERLYAYDCKIHGTIAKEIGNLTKLIILSLGSNELMGSIPSTIRELKQLQIFSLTDNKLQGSIPVDLCIMINLAFLDLSINELSGSIPACISNLTSLKELRLGSNKLTSIVPLSLWSLEYILVLNLSTNALESSLPLEVGNLKVVRVLDLSKNHLRGTVPVTIGSLQDLEILNLQKNRLQGQIPQSFGSMLSLKSLDLSDNNLSGTIPLSLAKLSYLQYLNLSFNSLEGGIPNGGPFANFSAQSFTMNKKLCGEARFLVPPCKTAFSSKGSKKIIIILLKYGLPAFMVIVLIVILLFIYMRRQKGVRVPSHAELVIPSLRRISYQEILLATEGLNERNILGRGSFGTVYRGRLTDGIHVAIKVFNLQVEGVSKSFDAECDALRNTRHRNLVKIIDACSNNFDFKALVLEYMSNGSLESWLYSHDHFLDIIQRLNITIDIASALEYLHHGQSTSILHCDLKPSNVLLDDNMVAHVSDFGISKLLYKEETARQTATLATIGYMAPEYGSEGIVSTKVDVYSFGILLMEIFTRKKPSDDIFEGDLSLKFWIEESLPHKINEVVDANLLSLEEEHSTAKKDCISAILELALCCSKESPVERINIKEALLTLSNIRKKLQTTVGSKKT